MRSRPSSPAARVPGWSEASGAAPHRAAQTPRKAPPPRAGRQAGHATPMLATLMHVLAAWQVAPAQRPPSASWCRSCTASGAVMRAEPLMCAKPRVGAQPDDQSADPLDDSDPPAVPTEYWRIARSRLELRHCEGVRRRKRRYLSFSHASAWAQRLGLSDQSEWEAWLERGEGLTSYVPSDPEAHYRATGGWVGWTAFLTGEPPTGEPPAGEPPA